MPAKSYWDAHPEPLSNTKTNHDRAFVSVAESERGPLLVEHKNCVAMQFHVDRKHPETQQILENFVSHHMYRIIQQGRVDIKIASANFISDAQQFHMAIEAEQNKSSAPTKNSTLFETVLLLGLFIDTHLVRGVAHCPAESFGH